MIFDQDLREDESERQSLSSLDQLLHESEINTPNLKQLVDSAMVSDTALNDENFDKYHKQRSIKKTILETALRNNDPRPVLDLTDAMAMMFDLDIGTDEAYEKFANAIIRAKLAAIEEMEARDIGKIDARPSDPIVTTFLEQYAKPGSDCIFNASLKNTHEDIMALHGQYVDDNPKGIGQDSLNQNRKSILLFLDSIGKNPSLGDFNRTKVREWRNLLKVFPVRATDAKCFKGLSMRETIEANKTIGKPVTTTRTVNKHLNYLSSFCNWLMIEGHIESNPVSRMLVPEVAKERSRKPFTIEQLNTIFASPLFNGCKDALKWHKSGELQINDHRYWLPLLALYTGARLAEIAQALTTDFEELHGRWIFRISVDGDDAKSLKNKSSARIVPLHGKLIELGFLRFLKSQHGNSSGRLFPEVSRNARGQIAGNFSRKWGKYLANIGVKHDNSINFHSFRHTFTDELRRAGHNDHEIDILLGHSQHSTTARYGIEAQGTIEQRAKLIDALQYEGFEYSRKAQ